MGSTYYLHKCSLNMHLLLFYWFTYIFCLAMRSELAQSQCFKVVVHLFYKKKQTIKDLLVSKTTFCKSCNSYLVFLQKLWGCLILCKIANFNVWVLIISAKDLKERRWVENVYFSGFIVQFLLKSVYFLWIVYQDSPFLLLKANISSIFEDMTNFHNLKYLGQYF